MLSAPPWPSRWTGPPGQRSPRSSVSTSITSELLRGPGSPLGSRPDLDVDRVERLDVVSPDQGGDGASAEIGRSRPHRHTPPSEDRWRSGTAPTSSLSCVRMRPSERGWWSSHSERRKGRRRSGGPGRSITVGGASSGGRVPQGPSSFSFVLVILSPSGSLTTRRRRRTEGARRQRSPQALAGTAEVVQATNAHVQVTVEA